jgi:hypothetical protein
MRHERVDRAAIAAAAWPSTIEGLVLAEPQDPAEQPASDETAIAGPAPAAPDIPPAVGGIIVGAYVSILMIFFALFTGSLTATFMVAVVAFFIATFFTIPRLFFALEQARSRRPSFSAFLDRGIDTLTGHSDGKDALVQMVLVPILLAFGLLAMGIVGKIYL